MNLLLINKNPVVSRMLNLSSPKVGYDIVECDNVNKLPKGEFDVVILDDEMYDENFLKEIRNSINFQQIGIIISSKNENVDSFDFVLIKPFLPTDLIELLRGIKAKLEFIKKEEKKELAFTPEDNLKDISEDENTQNILTINDEEPKEEGLKEEKEEIVQFEEEDEEPFIKESDQKSGIFDESEVEKVQELLDEDKDLEEEILKESQEEIKEEKDEIEESINKKPQILEKVEEYKNSKEKPIKEEYSKEEKIKALLGVLDLYSIRELLDGMEVTIKINFNKQKKKKNEKKR